MKYKESVQGRLTENSSKRIGKI